MLKAIVKDEAELKSLEAQKGYQVHFEEGDEAIGGGIRLIFINGSWQDKGEYDAKVAAEEKARFESEKARLEAEGSKQ